MWTKVVEGTFFNESNCFNNFPILYSLQKCVESFASIVECGSTAAAARQQLASRRPCSGLDSTSRRPCVARRWAWSSAAEVKGLAGRVAGRDRARLRRLRPASERRGGLAPRSSRQTEAATGDSPPSTVTALDHLSVEPFFRR